MNFKEAITESIKENYTVLFDAVGESLAHNMNSWEKKMAIFIGPEGGFTEKELEMARENNIKIISISPLMLRGETAAIVATYLAVNL